MAIETREEVLPLSAILLGDTSMVTKEDIRIYFSDLKIKKISTTFSKVNYITNYFSLKKKNSMKLSLCTQRVLLMDPHFRLNYLKQIIMK